jgi:hypothetical protein
MADIADILAQAENPEYVRVATARVLIRQDLLARHEELDAELQAAIASDGMHNRTPRAPALAAELEALEAEVEAAKVEFRFRSIGKRAWADLLAAHPPTREQKKADPRVDHNPDTFPAAAIAASCVDPVLTLDKIGGRWADSPSERAIREYACSRGIPRSVFLGRIVADGEPVWLEEDTQAALEWQEHKDSLCSGCGNPRDESFALENHDRYDVTALACHACAARERKAQVMSGDGESRPPAGLYFAVTGPTDD